MRIKRRGLLVLGISILGSAALCLVSAGSSRAHEYDVGKLKIEHPWVRAPKDGETTAYFYAFLHNSGDAPDKLVAVKSPKFGKVEFHADANHAVSQGGIAIPAKKQTTLQPDGAHVVLLDINKHLEVGWGLEMVLVFEKAGEVTIDASIDAPDAKHAHDAEAMERWEKAHSAEAATPSSAAGAEHQHHQHHHEHHMDGGAAAPAGNSK